MLTIQDFFQWESTSLAELFTGITYPWEALNKIGSWLEKQLESLSTEGERIQGLVQPGAIVGDKVIIRQGAVIEAGAMVKGPAYIGRNTVVRHGAYVREGSIIGDNCVVGHATEVKASILLDGSQAPHFNYVGNSILGKGVNLGAGAKLSNVKHAKTEIIIRIDDQEYPTGRIKLGAILGDGVALGCNAVSNPGTLVGPGTLVYPNALLRGVYPSHSIVKVQTVSEVSRRREAE